MRAADAQTRWERGLPRRREPATAPQPDATPAAKLDVIFMRVAADGARARHLSQSPRRAERSEPLTFRGFRGIARPVQVDNRCCTSAEARADTCALAAGGLPAGSPAFS